MLARRADPAHGERCSQLERNGKLEHREQLQQAQSDFSDQGFRFHRVMFPGSVVVTDAGGGGGGTTFVLMSPATTETDSTMSSVVAAQKSRIFFIKFLLKGRVNGCRNSEGRS
jgi:hypothetical protein